MFHLGSKIVVVASNNTSTTGPKRGSLGYPLGADKNTLVILNGGKTVIKQFDIMFVRYGYETKKRIEIRRVFMPILMNHKNTTLKDLEDVVSNPEIASKVVNELGVDSGVLVASMAPVDNFNIKTDLFNWVMVHVLNERNVGMFNNVADKYNEIHPVYLNKINRDVVGYIIDWANQKDSRNQRILDFLEDRSENTDQIITTINMVKVVYDMHNQINKLNGKQQLDPRRMLNALLNSVFIQGDLENCLLGTNYQNNAVTIREDVRNIRDSLFSFSRSAVVGA